MNSDVKKLWVERLRSGRDTQGKGALVRTPSNGPNELCCLGVLCEIAVEEGVHIDRSDSPYGKVVLFDGEDAELPHAVMTWAGLTEKNPDVTYNEMPESLALLNDGGMNFAGIIEAQL